MRWRTVNNRRRARVRRAARLTETMGFRFRPHEFKLYPYQRDVIDYLDFDAARLNEDRSTFDTGERKYQFFVATASGTDASWVRDRFERALRDVMDVPLEFIRGKRGTIIIDEHFNPERYRKD